jgi:hypothetical protein
MNGRGNMDAQEAGDFRFVIYSIPAQHRAGFRFESA